MTTRAYSQLFLDKACRTVGNMLYYAVVAFGIVRTDFLKRFIRSDVAEQLENGSPKYIAGNSRMELYTRYCSIRRADRILRVTARS